MTPGYALAARRTAALVLALGLLGGCATRAQPDPFEPVNRKVFAFNEGVDEAVLKPVATAYSEVVPAPVRLGVDNFFGNVADAWSAVNLFLQGRVKTGVLQTMRFAVNSTLGFAGVLDISTEIGLERHSEDMGKTFGRWGTGTGAYIVWPLFGPSSVRDSFALPFDRLASPAVVLEDGRSKFGIVVLQTVNARSNFLRAGETLDGIALDKYTFIRDAYLTKRRSIEDDEEDDYEVITPPPIPATPQAGQ